MTSHVWYVAYGSNLHRERFSRYLDNARDTTPPTNSQPFRVDHPVVFAGESKRWNGGGVAFLDVDSASVPASYGRAWRVTVSQFEDVFRQENGRAEVVPLEPDSVAHGSSQAVLDSWYGRVHRFGDIDGEAAVTFTRPKRPSPLNPADASYLRVIAGGLNQAWDLGRDDAARYLHRCPGLADGFSVGELHAALHGPIDLL